MRIELIKEEGKVIGYTIIAETLEDSKALGSVRDMQFWGFDGTELKYKGRTDSKDEPNKVATLSYMQALPMFQSSNEDEIAEFRKELLDANFHAENVDWYCKTIYKSSQLKQREFVQWLKEQANE